MIDRILTIWYRIHAAIDRRATVKLEAEIARTVAETAKIEAQFETVSKALATTNETPEEVRIRIRKETAFIAMSRRVRGQ